MKGRTERRVHVATLGRVLRMSASAELALEGRVKLENTTQWRTHERRRETATLRSACLGEPQHSEPPDADPHVR